ncbi:34175_t:CDS:2, partial [Gigaspora margarita]
MVSYLQQPVNGAAQPLAPELVEDPYKSHVSYECPTLGTNTNNNPRLAVNENERTRALKTKETSGQNRPTVDVNWAQAISEIPSFDPIFEAFAAKRRKKNDGEAEEVETLEENKEKKDDYIYKEKRVKSDSTYAQLFQVASNIRKEIAKITGAGKIVTSKIAKCCVKMDKEKKTTSMYSEH